MASTPRVAVDLERARTPFGVLDPFASFDGDLERRRRLLMELFYRQDALDQHTADLLRIGVALVVDCGICRLMRDTSTQAGDPDVLDRLSDPSGGGLPDDVTALMRFCRAFLGDPNELGPDHWRELGSRFDRRQIAQLLTRNLGALYELKTTIILGFEPATASDVPSVVFDRNRYDPERGVTSMQTEGPGS